MNDNYFGIVIEDPFRWLEEIDSPETKLWIDEQNRLTNQYLDKIPFRDKIKKRLEELWDYPKYMTPFRSGNNYFYLRNDGLQPQSMLYIQRGIDAEPEVLLDPNKFSEDGTVALLDINVSGDGKYLGYSVTKSGSDWLEIFVIDIEKKELLTDKIEWVKFSGAHWFKDGFFYNRYNSSETGNKYTSLNDNQMVYYHKLGTRQSDDILIYKDEENPHRSFWISSSFDERFIFLNVSELGKKGFRLYVNLTGRLDGGFIPITDDTYDSHTFFMQNTGDDIFLLTNSNAPRNKLIKLDARNITGDAETIIPETENTLSGVQISAGKIIATYMVDVADKVKVFSLNGEYLYDIELPGLGTVTGLYSSDPEDSETFYTFESITRPPEIYIYDIPGNRSKLFRKSNVNFDPEDFVTRQVFYNSKDGTKVPMFLAHRKDVQLNGDNPVYLYSYGGFNISMNPVFSDSRIILLENGGVFAMPCIRGGGEYGEKWHEAGMLKNKQNVFDDFIAAAEYLVKEKYTNPKKLAVGGGSNGGLLIGAVVNQRPELFRAAFPAVGVMDMLRFQKFSIGAAWVKEYGSSDDEEMFNYILKYSPLHNIRSDKDYPAILVLTSDHDDRVVPSHSFKYTATLQKIYKGKNPVLIRIETKAGHGFGKPVYKTINEQTDVWSFMFYNMEITPEY